MSEKEISTKSVVRYLSRRTFGDDATPQTSQTCQVETTDRDDRSWTFRTFGGVRGVAVVRGSATQAENECRVLSRLVVSDSDMWEQYYWPSFGGRVGRTWPEIL